MNRHPTYQEVETFVRNFAGRRPKVITPNSRLEADFGITGDDGDEFLEGASCHFNIRLAHPINGYRTTFNLGENEYLFHSEGDDLLGIGNLIQWLRKKPRPIYRDLTIGELHSAILRAMPQLEYRDR
ncbi:MAG: hypothetical protein JST38_06920 [Bacteroidetes bacterium]|nr:hypothetical protein [Bacteroidota bacterium]